MLPDIYLNFYSNIIAMDHVLNKCWIIATGFSRKKNINIEKNAKNKDGTFNQISSQQIGLKALLETEHDLKRMTIVMHFSEHFLMDSRDTQLKSFYFFLHIVL